MTILDAKNEMEMLKHTFDIVRLVDVKLNRSYIIDEKNQLVSSAYECYRVWKKSMRCENCISAKAYACHKQLTKFEFLESDLYFVISKYVVIEDKEYMLECVLKVTDDTLFNSVGRDTLSEKIIHYNEDLYIDPLTKAYNRKYYEEQIQRLNNNQDYCICMCDVDNFKTINDGLGHMVGDVALKSIVLMIKKHLIENELVIRYGGDEFLFVLKKMSKEELESRLVKLLEDIHAIDEIPNVKLSLSIGGVSSEVETNNSIQLADELLYQAKKTKNAVKVK